MVFSSSSSSDSNSDNEDIEIICHKKNKYRKKPRVKNFIENVIYAYDNMKNLNNIFGKLTCRINKLICVNVAYNFQYVPQYFLFLIKYLEIIFRN